MKYLQSIFAQFDLILMFILGVSLLLVVGDIIYAADITVGHSNVFQPANKDDLVRKLDEGGYYHAYSDTACGDINDWDTHLVIDMSDLFFGKVLF